MNRNLRWLGVGNAIRLLGTGLYGPFLSLFLHNVLGVGYLEVGLLYLVVGGIQVPFAFVGGLVTDRLGRRRVFLAGLAVEAAATAFLAYSFAFRSLDLAVLTATIGGIASTLGGPAISAYVADFTEGSERTLGFTWLRIGYNAGFAAGVALGGILIETIDFSGAVAVASAILFVGAAFVALILEPSPGDLARERGAPAELGARGGASAGRAATLRQSLAVLGRDAGFLEVAVAFTLASLVVSQWSFTFPLFVQNDLGIPYDILGVGLAVNGIVVVFGQNATTRSVLGRRHTSIAIGGVALYALAFILLALSGATHLLPIPAFFASVLILTIGENLITIPQSTLPSNLAPPPEVGAYNGAFQTLTIAGGLLAAAFGGWALSASPDAAVIWTILLLPVLPTVLLLQHAGGRIRADANRA